ncbi:hypothetical protein BC828DRAFT_404322 [Blastocladiella britannica]|nr:hypothetical protein BC828DRAFT_404322 [Blastocladiella britannica]
MPLPSPPTAAVDAEVAEEEAPAAVEEQKDAAPLSELEHENHLTKWIASLTSAVRSDSDCLRAELDQKHAEQRAADRADHAAALAAFEAQLETLRADAKRTETAAQWRPVGLALLAQAHADRRATNRLQTAWRIWTRVLHQRQTNAWKVHAARQMERRHALLRAFTGWMTVTRGTWREACERRIAAAAQDTIAVSTHDLRAQVDDLQQQLVEKEQSYKALQVQAAEHEHQLCAAVMRGLSALNIEAMAVLQHAPASAEMDAVPEAVLSGDNGDIEVMDDPNDALRLSSLDPFPRVAPQPHSILDPFPPVSEYVRPARKTPAISLRRPSRPTSQPAAAATAHAKHQPAAGSRVNSGFPRQAPTTAYATRHARPEAGSARGIV